MNSKNTWIWIVVAAVLFVAIFISERVAHKPDAGAAVILPGLKAAAVTSIQVRPTGESEIRVERTNGIWQLTKPIAYPAQSAAIETLLAVLERLTPATYITVQELRHRPKADEEFGFDSATSLIIQQGDSRIQILIGARTAPGDQVFLQVVGVEGTYVVDADLLKFIPQTMTGWRDTALVDLRNLAFDRIIVTNGLKVFELQRDPTNGLWRVARPMPARADNNRIDDALQKLQGLRVVEFVSDDTRADAETFGLQPAELDLAFNRGTNIAALLQFGKSPTNDSTLVYARRGGWNSVVKVRKDLREPWRASVNDFRDPHLLALTAPVDQIEVRGDDNFTVQRQDSNVWRFASQPFAADAGLVDQLLAVLATMQIVQFVNDVVTEPDLPNYGLAPPLRQIILQSAPAQGTNTNNAVLVNLSFGTNQTDKVFVRRKDEDSIYAVTRADFQRLPSAAWQLRERRIWNFTTNDVARVAIHQGGRVREILRNGPNLWSLAPGSQGVLEDLALDEVMYRLGELSAAAWVERGPATPDARYGFTTNGFQVTIELKNGDKRSVEFGGTSPSRSPYAAVALDGQTWIFEFPLALSFYVLRYLTIPAGAP